MQIKTRGVVLHKTKFSDNSSVVTIYTEHFGRTTFLVRGVNSKRSLLRAAFFMPMSILDIDMVHTPGKEMHTIKELSVAIPYNDIAANPVKNAIALFLSELLYRCIKLSTPDERLFLFITQSMEVLEYTEGVSANFNLVFLLRLTRYLGFEPEIDGVNSRYFDLQNGVFCLNPPLHMHYTGAELANKLTELSAVDYFSMNKMILSRNQRMDMLKMFVEYYRLHVPGFHGLNSLQVLQALFD